MTSQGAPPVTPVDIATVPSPVRSDAAQLLQGVIAHTADAVICTDDAQRILIFNPAAERIFGYSGEEMLGGTIECLVPRAARGAMRPWFDGIAAASGDTSEHRRVWGRRKSGELFPAEASLSRLTVGEATYFTALLRDVSQERRAEKERAAMLARTFTARTTAEHAEKRMAFLADIGEILHSSLAVEETLTRCSPDRPRARELLRGGSARRHGTRAARPRHARRSGDAGAHRASRRISTAADALSRAARH